jgi:hypothetical protein
MEVAFMHLKLELLEVAVNGTGLLKYVSPVLMDGSSTVMVTVWPCLINAEPTIVLLDFVLAATKGMI